MTDFFADFIDAFKTVPLIRYVLFAGIVSSLTFGVVGSLIVVRQIGYVASAIAHSILGGIGASVYFCRVYE
jgi:zinc transport system permease protein